MRILIIPLRPVYRVLRRGALKILGKEELEDLKTDLVTPVAEFIDEVYDDTVGDLVRDSDNTEKRP